MTSGRARPEVLSYLLGSWAVMIAGELAFQVVNAIGLAADPSALRQAAGEVARSRGQEVSAEMIALSTYTSIAMMAVFQLLIIALLAVALRAVAGRWSWARGAKRLLSVFSVYFAIRAGLVVVAPSAVAAATSLPVAVPAVLGAAQIIVGVAAVCALIYASREEVDEFISGDAQKGG
ncbi:hypothetical protein [Corynebacterium liangguodongii]|uniref:Uncharacterized protein n=1 Tax=Corynebacterium liangguodongii TaxID=2079535 RepID=A0A2S0WBZ0_9CORY|nr:hypothetical protein [Corynebacterium liangguodongii]AWB83289.1 hypothetical protein C3E79_01315 [Corynebacterium liangguodongii]PWC00621.1 hypothetical protein DF219_01635 [Corynebacterium liangguodongii]